MPRRALNITILFALLSSTLPRVASADTTTNKSSTPVTDAEQSEARERYTRGLQLSNEGKYDVALIEMQRAYALNPSYKILYNLGQIHVHLADYASALKAYERFLSEGGSDIPAPRANEVAAEIAKIRPRVATVDLEVKGDGADVLIDDQVIGRSPFHKKIPVNSGKHKFSAVREGSEPVARVVPLAGEDSTSILLDLTRPEPTAARSSQSSPAQKAAVQDKSDSPIVEPPVQATSRGSRYTWVGWTVTAALGVGSGIAAVIAKQQSDHLRDLRDTPGASRQALDDGASSTFRAALVTDLLLGATAVAAGVSLYYTLSAKRDPTRESANGDTTLELGLSGLRLRRSF